MGKLDTRSGVGIDQREYVAGVAISVPSDRPSSSFAGVLRQAGAVFARREGPASALHYGSAAGELAVCVRAVGLVDRSELTKLVLEAPVAQLRHLTERLTGATVEPGGALHSGGAWWCGVTPQQLIVLCEPSLGTRLKDSLQGQALHHVEVSDRSGDWAALELVGTRAGDLLRGLGAYGSSGDPRRAAPFSQRTMVGIEARVLLESDRRALLLVASELAADVWRAIEQLGRPFGISCVGLEAARRYALLERGRPAALHS